MLGIGYTIIGRLSDICGRRYFVVGGNLLGVIGCIVAATSQSIPILIGANVLTGLASAAQTSTPSVLGELIPLKHRFAVTGLMYTAWVLPGSFGAAISYGFVLYTANGWRNVYWLLLATNASATILWTIFYHPPTFIMKNARTRVQMLKDFDYGGFILFTGGLIIFLMGLSWGGAVYPWKSAHVLATLIVGACTLVAFVLYENYMPLVDPLIPMHLFRNAGVYTLYPSFQSSMSVKVHLLTCFFIDWVVSFLVLGLGGTVYYGFAIIWPQMVFGIYTTDVHYGSILAFVPTVAITVGTCCSGVSRYITHTKLQIVISAVIGIPLVAACACLTVDNQDTILGLMITGCFFVGYIEGVGVTGTALSLEDQADIGVGTGVAATMRGVIATLGTAVYVSVLSNRLAQTIPQEVPKALIGADLPASSIEAFIGAISTGSFDDVPGATESIIAVGTAAYKQALALAYRTVFLTTLAFGLLTIILSFFYPNFDDRMPNETVAILRNKKDRAAIEQQRKAAMAQEVNSGGNHGSQQDHGEKQMAMDV